MMPVHMTEYAIGLDLGGTNLRAAAIDKSGTLLDKISGATKFEEGREAVLSDIVAAISKLRETHGAPGLSGIGVGVPGFIRMKEGLITNSNNLPYLENVPIRDVLSAKLETRVILENDANAAALGEKWMGAGRDVDDLVLLTLGTGIGGGIISGGRIVRGSVGMAGEFGHISVVPNGNPCGCGNQGCLEKHASATAVSAMARLMQLGEDLTAKDVYELASQDTEAGEFSVRTKATTSAACFSVTPETGFIFPCPLRMTCFNWSSVLACTSLEASGACVTLYILAMAALPSPFGP